jgi:hypothetical protein
LNAAQLCFDGDISMLLVWSHWRGLYLDRTTSVVWSHEDLRGAFYLFALPPAWAPLFAFNWPTRGERIGLDPGRVYYPAAVTLPMGWLSAMGLMQAAHRNLVAGGLGNRVKLDLRREIRRGRPMAWTAPLKDFWHSVWQVYCDDYDCAEFVEAMAARDGVAISASRDEEQVLAHFHGLARQLYEDFRVPISRPKSGVRKTVVARLGVQVDGSRGIISLGADKAAKLLSMTTWFLKPKFVTRHALQVIAGHWSHAVQLRRVCSGSPRHRLLSVGRLPGYCLCLQVWVWHFSGDPVHAAAGLMPGGATWCC